MSGVMAGAKVEAKMIEYVLDHMHKNELREVASFYKLAKSGTKRIVSQRITGHLNHDPLSLISPKGPWYRDQWNDFVQGALGGQRRRSYERIRQEIWELMRERGESEVSTCDDLWFCTVASVLRDDRVEDLSRLVGRSVRSVRSTLRRAHGNKLVRNLFELDDPTSGEGARVFRVVNDRYQIVKEVGKGGFASVYEAKDLRFPARGRVVLKFPLESEDDEYLEREIVRAFDLSHENICRYYDLDQELAKGRRVPFLVIEYGGESLESIFDQLDPDERFSRMFAYRVVDHISEALDYASERHHIIHGDVNPGNILIGDDDVIRLTDFGLAARLRPTRTSRGHRTLMGTSLLGMHQVYSAPEVLAGRRARRSSDQYSLAMVFCAMMEGKLFDNPYQRRDFSVLTRKQNAALERALELDPRNRFPSCSLFAQALRGR